MYKECQLELYGRITFQTNKGFIVFKQMEDKSMYLHLIFIQKEYRRERAAWKLLTNLLDMYKATVAYSYVDTTTENPEQSIAAHLAYGFKIYRTIDNQVQFKLERETNKGEKDE